MVQTSYEIFQGGCGEVSAWGDLAVQNKTNCAVSVMGNVEVKGSVLRRATARERRSGNLVTHSALRGMSEFCNLLI